ncbi:MAG: M48 family metalloprotease [Candidatus Tyrphobacter sp.]
MTPLSRAAASLVVAALVAASLPTRALALSTQQEIRQGQAEDEQITRSEVIETDPLLNAYARSIANKLWLQVARKDVPYNIKIVKSSDINSFATEGGFVYIDEGLIDFAQSDDEFASVIGHETGHIERRHVVSMNAKAELLSLLLGLASIFSPFIYYGGNVLAQTVMAKVSREDELEADRYGLQLMSRAGYDPDSMVTMMSHMAALEDEHNELVDKYLEDHPDAKARIAHLLGYPELDPTVVTEQQRLVQAVSDSERARYSFAYVKLRAILDKHPRNVEALLHLAQVQLALGLTSKSAQTLAQAAQLGSSQARALVAVRQAQLRDIEVRRALLIREDPNFHGLVAEIDGAHRSLAALSQGVWARESQARDRLKSQESRLTDLQFEIPNLGNITIRPNSHLASIVGSIEAMSRALNSALDDDEQVLANVGSLEPDKQGGMLLASREVLDEMAAPLALAPVPDDSLALFPSYGTMLGEIGRADDDLVRSVDESRTSLDEMDAGIGELDALFRALDDTPMGYQGDIGQSDFNGLHATIATAVNDLDDAATTASQAAQLYNMARARQYSVRITLLGVGASPQRFATLQHALDVRFASSGLDYATMLRDGITAGDDVAATIVAADIGSTPQAIVEESLRTKTPITDLANEHGMHAWPLEIFMRLTYLDYTDDPVKELSDTGRAAAGLGF